ncbi:hypothetical protein [Geodermatophilus marinus]|nr:hypothetical protein [Geodermatophilus sp. LHW52908]
MEFHVAVAAAVTDLFDATDVSLVAESMGDLAGAPARRGQAHPRPADL